MRRLGPGLVLARRRRQTEARMGRSWATLALCASSTVLDPWVATESRHWVVDPDDEYTMGIVDLQQGRAWTLSCGTYVGPPVYGLGVHYHERAEGRDKGTAWQPRSVDIVESQYGAAAVGEWVYAMLHGTRLPTPFAVYPRPLLANFGSLWRAAESEDVCIPATQAYRRALAMRAGYPAEVLGDGWGLEAEDTNTLVYAHFGDRVRDNPPNMVRIRLSCRHGLHLDTKVYEAHEEYTDVTPRQTYGPLGWGQGDERVVHALLGRDSELPADPSTTALDGVGFARLWPHFAARCPEAEAAYSAFAR